MAYPTESILFYSGTGSVVINASTPKLRIYIDSIEFVDPNAYTISLDVYRASTSSSSNLFTWVMSAGDVIRYNKPFLLLPGDYLTVTTSSVTTNYTITGYSSLDINV